MRIDRKTWWACRRWVIAEELKPFEREFGAREAYPSLCSCCPDAQSIRHVQERRSLRRKMRMIQIHSQNSKSSAPGYSFQVPIPREASPCSAPSSRAAALPLFDVPQYCLRPHHPRFGVAGRERKKTRPRRDRAFLDRKADAWRCATPKSSLRDKRGSDIELRCNCRRDAVLNFTAALYDTMMSA